MKQIALIFSMILLSSGISFGQKGVDDNSTWGKGEDSIRCIKNYSLYRNYARQKNYADALPFWEVCYQECPLASKNLYTDGALIIKWQISQAPTDEEKEVLFNNLMALYDKRIQYFGDDARYPTGYILQLKTLDYIRFKSQNVSEIHSMYEEVLKLRANQLPSKMLQSIMAYTIRYYSEGGISANLALDRYKEISDLMEAKDDKEGQRAIDNMIVTIASCENLVEIYSGQLEEKKNDLEWIEKSLRFMARAGCKEEPLYFQLAEIKHESAPSSATALGMASRCIQNKDYNKGEDYLLQAIELEEDANEKAEHCYKLAQMSYTVLNSYSKARQYCLAALKHRPNWGDPYILIAQLYSASAQKGNLGPDEISNRAGYWAAYDKALQAKQVDPSVSAKADNLMNQYKQQFPKKTDIFMHPDYTEGEKITVGGWIGESTTIRPN